MKLLMQNNIPSPSSFGVEEGSGSADIIGVSESAALLIFISVFSLRWLWGKYVVG